MSGEALKYDTEKPRTDLLPGFPLVCIARVLGYGAQKYAAHNWRKGMEWSRPYGAALRHMLAWNEGEDTDPESGLNHIDHALCELMFLRQYIADCPELDNRYKREAVKECLLQSITKSFSNLWKTFLQWLHL